MVCTIAAAGHTKLPSNSRRHRPDGMLPYACHGPLTPFSPWQLPQNYSLSWNLRCCHDLLIKAIHCPGPVSFYASSCDRSRYTGHSRQGILDAILLREQFVPIHVRELRSRVNAVRPVNLHGAAWHISAHGHRSVQASSSSSSSSASKQARTIISIMLHPCQTCPPRQRATLRTRLLDHLRTRTVSGERWRLGRKTSKDDSSSR